MRTPQGTYNLIISHGDNDTLSPMIAEIYSDGGRLPAEANAQAIAVLPELVEAYKYAKAGIDDILRGVWDIPGALRILQVLQHALAKVEGK